MVPLLIEIDLDRKIEDLIKKIEGDAISLLGRRAPHYTRGGVIHVYETYKCMKKIESSVEETFDEIAERILDSVIPKGYDFIAWRKAPAVEFYKMTQYTEDHEDFNLGDRLDFCLPVDRPEYLCIRFRAVFMKDMEKIVSGEEKPEGGSSVEQPPVA